MTLGGHLLSIHSLEEQDWIQDNFESHRYDTWIGGVDPEHNGDWGWTDGTKWDFTNWINGQPMGDGSYVVLLSGIWRWLDYDGSNEFYYFCQLVQ